MKIARLLLRSLSEAATLFLTDRAGPGRFIICDLPAYRHFVLRMREMNGIFEFGAIYLNAYALRRVFKWVIYVVRKILSREMKDYNKFTHISNTVDMHFVCRDFG